MNFRMNYNLNRVIVSLFIFCFCTTGIFGYSIYEASLNDALSSDQQNNLLAGQQLDSSGNPIGQASSTTSVDFINYQATSTYIATTTSAQQSSATISSPPKQIATSTPASPSQNPGPTQPPTAIPVDTTTNTTTDVRRTSKYKDGTYSAVGTYDSPAGYESIGISVTLQNDIVADSSATAMAQDRTSSRYQQMFISGYKQYVIGQNIDTIRLSWVSGSSLTPVGFNQALAKIKVQAQS